MYRLVTTLLAILAGSTLVYAADPMTATTMKPAAMAASDSMAKPVAVVSAAAKVMMLSGKIDSATVADQTKGTKSEIVVVDENNKTSTFLVKATTTIYNANLEAITLDKLMKDNKVSVKYMTTPEGVNEALSISLVK